MNDELYIEWFLRVNIPVFNKFFQNVINTLLTVLFILKFLRANTYCFDSSDWKGRSWLGTLISREKKHLASKWSVLG